MRAPFALRVVSARNPLRRAAALSARRLTAFFAAAAVLINCVLVQTHVDRPLHAFADAARVYTAPADDHSGGADAILCPVCQVAAATAGMALQPQLVVEAPSALVLLVAGHADTSIATLARSHAWRSRAPPFLA